MDWQDEGIVLAARPHGETSVILEVLTAGHGRHLGVVRGGASRRMAAHLQPGSQLALHWQARLSDHLGQFRAEPVKSRAAVLADRRALTALNALTALLHLALPEREPQPALYARTQALADQLATAGPWEAAYLLWERDLLDALGFGLDLTACALTGATEGLAYVSPKTGRAVAAAAAGDWAPRLLPLPPVLTGWADSPADRPAALTLTGHFLLRGLEAVLDGRPLPEARARLADLFAREAAAGPA